MFFQNKYDLKKLGDFTVSKGHRYPLVIYIYIYIVKGCGKGCSSL